MMNRPYDTFRSEEHGIVLPVVLVMLLLMTVTVTLLMRRGTVDELLASNVRQITTLDTAAQHALRTCERLLWAAPPGVPVAPGDPLPPTVVTATVRPPAAASPQPTWRTAANAEWVVLPQADFDDDGNAATPSPVSAAACLFEDASAELERAKTTKNFEGSFNLDDTYRKYRITAEVQGRLDFAGRPNAFGRAQAEVRMNVVAP